MKFAEQKEYNCRKKQIKTSQKRFSLILDKW